VEYQKASLNSKLVNDLTNDTSDVGAPGRTLLEPFWRTLRKK